MKMDAILKKDFARCVLLSSAGFYASMGANLNVITVPALLASKDPVPTWHITYNRGKNLAFLTIFTTTGAALRLFYSKGDLRYLVTAALSLSAIPYTLKFMKSTNDKLHALKRGKPEEVEQEAKELIVTWGGLQWVRTALGVSAFVVALHAIFYK